MLDLGIKDEVLAKSYVSNIDPKSLTTHSIETCFIIEIMVYYKHYLVLELHFVFTENIVCLFSVVERQSGVIKG